MFPTQKPFSPHDRLNPQFAGRARLPGARDRRRTSNTRRTPDPGAFLRNAISGSPSAYRYAARSPSSRRDVRFRERTRDVALVGHADFGARRSRRHRDLCAQIARNIAREYRPETSPPAARDRRGRLRCDGPGTGGDPAAVGRLRRDSICAGRARRSSSWRSWRWSSRRGRADAAATGPDSDLAPVRGLRRLAQTTNVGGVEYLQRAKLNASDAAEDDQFGFSVSIDGAMVIGAQYDDDKGTDSGSAYVFTRNTPGDLASGWTQVAKLTAADGAAVDLFGYSVSIDGDTVVIGAYEDDDDGTSSGSAYVFTRVTAGDLASGWAQVAKLTAGTALRMTTSATACRLTATRW